MPSTTTILTSIPLLSAISVTFITNHKMKHHRSYIETRTISTSFVRSTTLLRSVNPKHYIRNGLVDTRTIEISNDNIQRLSDEEILARFSKGFFGGWAFFPERTGLWILKMLFGWDLKSSFTGKSYIFLSDYDGYCDQCSIIQTKLTSYDRGSAWTCKIIFSIGLGKG